MNLIKRYDSALISNPLTTKMISNGIICFTGDAICQQITKRYFNKSDEKFDLHRALRFSACGAFISTTCLHFYLTYIVPHIKFSKSAIQGSRARNWATIFLRIGAHTTTLMPVRWSAFFFGLGALQHGNLKAGYDKWKECFYEGMKEAVCFWPLVSLGLYSVVPFRWGNLYMDCFNLIFMVMISFLVNNHDR